MYRIGIVLLCMTLQAWHLPEAAARTKRQRQCCQSRYSPCCTAADSQPISSHLQSASSSVEPCICLKDALDTYPTQGGYETLYLAEQHNDGCPSVGNCQNPETTFRAGEPDQPPQECSLFECSDNKNRLKSPSGLEKPVPVGHVPTFAGDLGKIAEIIHTDQVIFHASQRGWIRAIVYIVKLPLDSVIRPGQPVRIVAFGYEVEPKPKPEKVVEIDHRYVRSTANPCLFMLDCGGVRYAVVVTSKK